MTDREEKEEKEQVNPMHEINTFHTDEVQQNERSFVKMSLEQIQGKMLGHCHDLLHFFGCS